MDINLYSPHERVSQTSLLDTDCLTVEDIFEILHRVRLLKRQQRAKEKCTLLSGKIVAAILDRPSVRTKAALELAVARAGGSPVVLNTRSEREKSGESLPDIVRSLETFGFDAFFVRTGSQEELVKIAAEGKKPFINGKTDERHPTQALCDLYTLWEKKGKLAGLKIAYVGRPTGALNSLLIGAAKCGVTVAVACPEARFPKKEIVESAEQYGEILLTSDPEEAVRGVDAVYTDGFSDVAQEEREEKAAEYAPYRVTGELMEKAAEGALFMHPLPLSGGLEAETGVAYGAHSAVLDQAENRPFTLQAVLSLFVR